MNNLLKIICIGMMLSGTAFAVSHDKTTKSFDKFGNETRKDVNELGKGIEKDTREMEKGGVKLEKEAKDGIDKRK